MEIKYIINEENEQLKKYTNETERKFLRSLLDNNFDEADELIEQLSSVYPNNVTLAIINILFGKVMLLMTDETVTSKHDFRKIKGNFYEVFSVLLLSDDYYRMMDLVSDEMENYNKDDEIDIAFSAINYLTLFIYQLNERNIKKNNEKIEFKSNKNNFIDTIRNYSLSVYPLEILKKIDEEIEIKDEVNYYELYLNHYENNDYENCYEDIRKFYTKMSDNGIFVNVDYIVLELETLLKNKDKLPEYIKIMNEIKEKLHSLNYGKAIELYCRAYEIIPNGQLLAKMGDCFRILNISEGAIESYKAAEEFISPEQIENLMEFLYKEKKWNDIIIYYDEYENYYEGENIKLTYMASIAALNKELYDLAIDLLDICELIEQDIYGLEVNFDYEKDIVRSKEKKIDVEAYTMEDFVDFSLNQEEIELSDYINEIYDTNLDEYSMEQLFSICKILVNLDMIDELDNILNYIKNRTELETNSRYQKIYKKYSSFYSSFVL